MLAGYVFHGQRDVIGLEVTYVEDCLKNGKSVAVVDVGSVHWALDALGTLLFGRLYHQEVAHFFEVFLQMIARSPFETDHEISCTKLPVSEPLVSTTPEERIDLENK